MVGCQSFPSFRRYIRRPVWSNPLAGGLGGARGHARGPRPAWTRVPAPRRAQRAVWPPGGRASDGRGPAQPRLGGIRTRRRGRRTGGCGPAFETMGTLPAASHRRRALVLVSVGCPGPPPPGYSTTAARGCHRRGHHTTPTVNHARGGSAAASTPCRLLRMGRPARSHSISRTAEDNMGAPHECTGYLWFFYARPHTGVRWAGHPPRHPHVPYVRQQQMPTHSARRDRVDHPAVSHAAGRQRTAAAAGGASAVGMEGTGGGGATPTPNLASKAPPRPTVVTPRRRGRPARARAAARGSGGGGGGASAARTRSRDRGRLAACRRRRRAGPPCVGGRSPSGFWLSRLSGGRQMLPRTPPSGPFGPVALLCTPRPHQAARPLV